MASLLAAAFLWLCKATADQRLVRAVLRDDVDGVRRAIEWGADVDRMAETIPGHLRTPIHDACRNPQIVRLLLEAGADPSSPSVPKGVRPLVWAAMIGHPESMTLLIEAGADVHARDANSKSTVLHNAVVSKDPRKVRLLLDAGADPEARDRRGLTPLMDVREKPGTQIAKMLIDAGADVHATDQAGRTPLSHVAERLWSGPLVSFLIDAGATVDARDDLGRTALSYAAALGCDDSVEALIAGGAQVDARDHAGMTPLMYVGVPSGDSRGHGDPLRIVELLLEAGADPQATDDEQHDVLWHARQQAWPVVIEQLERAAGKRGHPPPPQEQTPTLPASRAPS